MHQHCCMGTMSRCPHTQPRTSQRTAIASAAYILRTCLLFQVSVFCLTMPQLHFASTDAIFQKTNRVARRVLRPLGYKMLQVQGLDPASVSPAAARAALEADLTPEQQAAVDAEAERLFKQVCA